MLKKRTVKRSSLGSGEALIRGLSRITIMYVKKPAPISGINREKNTAGIPIIVALAGDIKAASIFIPSYSLTRTNRNQKSYALSNHEDH
jgi:hypothetical protein